MEIPPSMPPLVYRYKTMELLRFTYFGLACTVIFPIAVFNVIFIRMPAGILFFLLVAIFTGTMAWASINFLWRRFGARLEIRTGKLFAINRDGRVRVEGYVTDINELRSLYIKPNDVPMEYMVIFTGNQKLRFESQVENVAELKKTLEERSGKNFVRVHRNQP